MKIAICWLRRDLRLKDNTALNQALKSGLPVLPLFIFDTQIIGKLPADDARVCFIYQQLEKIHAQLRQKGSSLLVQKGDPISVWKQLLAEYEIEGVFFNRDYEPYAQERDAHIKALLHEHGIPAHTCKDQVIMEPGEVLKDNGTPYTVFTPFKKKWLRQFLMPTDFTEESPFLQCYKELPSMASLGLKPSAIQVRPYDLSHIAQYDQTRDLPALDQTSHLSPHLRFGTVSIRQIIEQVAPHHESFVSELVWREFFMHILYHFPRVVEHNFKSKYDGIRWRNNEEEFDKWCKGQTGFPMVDAGMRELNQTGNMHNRVRMVVASFLCKHLLIDWRWGEAYFAEKLLDFELSSNNGNWQWAAGTGCDAAPYFRVFNPSSQLDKFDKQQEYVRKWIPELSTPDYMPPMVDHKMARQRAIDTYKQGLGN